MKIIFLLILISISTASINEIKYVSKIKLNGNSNIKSSQIISKLTLKPSKLFTRSNFTLKLLNKDKIIIESLYKSKGFLDVIILYELEYINNKYIKINYHIDEGKQYFLKNIQINGNNIFSDEHILSILYSENKYYNPYDLRKKIKKIRSKYLNIGKLDIKIMDEILISNNNILARINIYEGNTYYINNININGLYKIKDNYVNRELTFKKGDIYNKDLLNKSKDNIFNSRLFSSVEIIHSKTNIKKNLIDINIQLREYKSSSIEANFSIKQLEPDQTNIITTGINIDTRWRIGNLMNTSSNIDIEARLASEINSKIFYETPLIERDISLNYFNPWTLFFRIPFRLKIFHEEEFDKYDIIKNGITYSLIFNEQPIKKYEINSTIEFINSSIDSLNNNEKRNIQFKYILNKIKEPINPMGGHYLFFNTELNGSILGGNSNYTKFESEYRKYIKLFSNNIFAIRLLFGIIYELESNSNINKSDKFFLGGHTTLRGWSGPEQTIHPNGNFIKNMLNMESRYLITDKWGAYFFYDAGLLINNYNKIKDSKILWNNGIGLLYNTTVGPIRLDIAFPHGDFHNSQLHASLLYMF